MRSELFNIWSNGGPLVTPLFATNLGFTEDVQSAKDISSVMYGQAIRVDFMFKQFTTMKEVRFPAGTQWVNLNTMDVIIAPAGNTPLSTMQHTGLDRDVNMF